MNSIYANQDMSRSIKSSQTPSRPKGQAKHCCGKIVAKANVSQFSYAWKMCCGTNFAAWKQKMFLPQDKNILLPGHKFCIRKHVSQFSHYEKNVDEVPVLLMQNVSPTNGESTTIACFQTVKDSVQVCKFHMVIKCRPSFTKCPSLV